jgi:uncharacterized membrane protein YqjE
MVIDEEIKKKGSLTLGLSMILSVIVMYAIVLPIMFKIDDEYVVTTPFTFLVILFGYTMLATIFYYIMTLIVKLFSKLLSKDHI